MNFEYAPSGPSLERFHASEAFTRVMLGPLGCLSGDTEFLTDGGWKRMDAYSQGDRVAAWTPEAGKIAMVLPLDFINLPCEEFWHFHNKYGLSMVLSDEHQVPLYDYRGRFVVKSAADLAAVPSRYAVPVSFAGPDGPGLNWGEPQIRLAVAINADGCLPKNSNQVVICVRKERKKRRLRILLSDCGLEWQERNYPARPTETSFVFERGDFTKGFGLEWWGSSAEELGWILDECLHWDGLADHVEQRFFSGSKGSADFIQYAAHATGRRASIAEIEYDNPDWKACYSVQITTPGSVKAKVMLRGDHTQIDRIKSNDGRKYCFRTTSGFFVARHDNKIFITGNSGKTTGCCYEILRRALTQAPDPRGIRSTRWLICRQTTPELETTTLPSWRQHFGTELGNWRMTVPITHAWRFPLDDGTRVEADIYFMGLEGEEAVNKVRGMELTGAWVNECKDIYRPIIDMITGRVGRYPAKKMGGPSWYGIIADTNMPDDDHWLYTLAEVIRPDGWDFFRQPGGVIKVGDKWVLNPAAENLRHLPENYYQNQLAGKSEEWIRVYLGAEYGYVSEGRPVYPEYSDIHHVAEFDYVDGVELLVGADLGLVPAAVFAQQDAWGRLWVLDELLPEDIGAAVFAKTIKQHIAVHYPGARVGGAWGDPIGEKRQQGDEDARTTFQIMAANGVVIRPAPGNNELVLRREAVAGMLTSLVDGKPGLIINRRCVRLRGGMSGKYCFKRVAQKGDVFADKPNKNNGYADVSEALQYLALGLGHGKQIIENKQHMKIRKPNVITGTKFSQHVVRRRLRRSGGLHG